MPLRTRLNISGPGLFFVTTTVTKWIPLFKHNTYAQTVLLQLNETSKRHNVSIVGYVLMPSHLHAMVGLKEINQLSQFIKAFKSISSRKLKQIISLRYSNQLLRAGRFTLWQPRFDDLLIRSEKQFKIKMEYIHNNPVKVGIVSDAIDFRYSSASDWLGEQHGLIEIDKNFEWIKESSV
jgi:REP-associated tyrosine transposase